MTETISIKPANWDNLKWYLEIVYILEQNNIRHPSKDKAKNYEFILNELSNTHGTEYICDHLSVIKKEYDNLCKGLDEDENIIR